MIINITTTTTTNAQQPKELNTHWLAMVCDDSHVDVVVVVVPTILVVAGGGGGVFLEKPHDCGDVGNIKKIVTN